MTPVCVTAPGLAARHGFFTRLGGVSTGPYASLNGSFSGGDRREAVAENRRRIAASLGATALAGLTQVHGPTVAVVDAAWTEEAAPPADALVTDRPGRALAIITADCAPVLLHDARAGVIGAAHAGWRGAVAGIVEATLQAMAGLGARADRISAAIGPCIGQASYEVGPDLREAVLAGDGAAARFFADGRAGHWQFDLAAYVAARLAAAGVRQVSLLGLDTRADEARFFSHRRRTLAGGGPIGHQVSAVVL